MAWSTDNISVTTTEVELVGGIGVAGRQYVSMTNLGPFTIWIGPTGVTPKNGFPIYVRRTIRGNNVTQIDDENIFAITASGTCQVRLVEAS